ncbi:MAG: CHASE3 domain-containing protein [Ferruginibacter sp.]
MKIYQRIGFVYVVSGISVAILVILGLLYMEKSREQFQYIEAVEHTYRVLSSIDFCEKILIEAETAQRGYLLTGETTYRETLELMISQVDSSLKLVGVSTADNNGQRIYFFQLIKFVTLRISFLKEDLISNGRAMLYFENLRKGVNAMENCRFYMRKMRALEEGELKKRLELKNKYQGLNLTYFKATFITACLICIIAIAIFFRELRMRLTIQQNLRANINELHNSKKELEEITFAASHDLQEPMRKVRILSNLITKKFANKIPEDDLEVVYRINKVTEQMHGLLNDLVLYTNLLNPNEKYSEVNLYDAVKEAYNKVFKNTNVVFQISPEVPVIIGSSYQVGIMLVHILENALKFKAPERELSLSLTYELKPIKESKFFWEHLPSAKYHQVTITDNGIGFDDQYNEKIFGLFQRLHTNAEYPGKVLACPSQGG